MHTHGHQAIAIPVPVLVYTVPPRCMAARRQRHHAPIMNGMDNFTTTTTTAALRNYATHLVLQYGKFSYMIINMYVSFYTFLEEVYILHVVYIAFVSKLRI